MTSTTCPERVVVKIGTSSLISGRLPAPSKVAALAEAVVRLRAAGRQPVLVTSGAIALGTAHLDTAARQQPAARQMAAAVGQSLLFEAFRDALQEHDLTAAQILLTPPDLTGPEHQAGTKTVLEGALKAGLVPVVNENDVVAVRNNDVLAALAAALLRAGRLVLLTDVPGLYESDPRRAVSARHITEIPMMTPEVERRAGAAGLGLGTGGMPAKLCAVWIASLAGVPTAIANAQTADDTVNAVLSTGVGTLIHARTTAVPADLGRLWRALSSPPTGRLICGPDILPILADGGPLLARHVGTSAGRFERGDVVDVLVTRPYAESATLAARGCTSVGATSLAQTAPHRAVLPLTDYINLLEV